MTPKTLRTLLHKKTLTSGQRQQVLREANRLLNQSINCFAAIAESCDSVVRELGDEPLKKVQEHADQLEETRDALEELVEKLDNLDIPDLGQVR